MVLATNYARCCAHIRRQGRGMSEVVIRREVRRLYEIHEWRNALAVLAAARPREWNEILTVLGGFRLLRSDILAIIYLTD